MSDVNNNAVHLCISCSYDYPNCPCENVLFGDGKGNDNICCCSKYDPLWTKEMMTIHGEEQMMSEREKYMERLWDTCDCNEGVLHYTIMDIAWSLRNIAEMLLEMNGYVDPHKYMEGVDDE